MNNNIDTTIKKLRTMKFNGGWKFLFGVLLVYLVVSLRYKYLVLEGLISSVMIFMKILPVMLVVFVIMLITNYFIKQGVIKKYLGESSGFKGYFYAVISGVLIAGPPYVLYPLLGDMKKGGMKNSLLAVFLFNRNVKIPFIPIMIFYFGLAFTVTISVLIILFSLLNGYIIGKIVKE